VADLDTLIRVRKHTVDQKQKFLAELYRQAEELDRQKSNLEHQLREEQETVKDMGVEMLNFFGSYAKAVKGRIEEIEEGRAKLETRINFAREDMRLAFAEMKKIEIINERRKAEAQAEIDKKESDTLNDIGIEGFRRQEEQA
jgi:flagellar FliJ protein